LCGAAGNRRDFGPISPLLGFMNDYLKLQNDTSYSIKTAARIFDFYFIMVFAEKGDHPESLPIDVSFHHI
jgi:hypothetical protein